MRAARPAMALRGDLASWKPCGLREAQAARVPAEPALRDEAPSPASIWGVRGQGAKGAPGLVAAEPGKAACIYVERHDLVASDTPVPSHQSFLSLT